MDEIIFQSFDNIGYLIFLFIILLALSLVVNIMAILRVRSLLRYHFKRLSMEKSNQDKEIKELCMKNVNEIKEIKELCMGNVNEIKEIKERCIENANEIKETMELGKKEFNEILNIKKITKENSSEVIKIKALAKENTRIVDKMYSLSKSNFDKFPKILERQGRKEFRQLESFYWLNDSLKLHNRPPWLRGWVASPDLLLYLYETVQERKPQLIVEFGSGFSTVVLAEALKQIGYGQVISLEHIDSFANLTKNMLVKEELIEYVDIRLSPLVKLNEAEDDNYWYDPNQLSDIYNVDLVFVDGPPGSTCKHARYPALPVLIDRLNDDAVILLDDANRLEEREIIEKWQSKYGLNVKIFDEFDKGLAVINWNSC